jgi:hypothetical protein
MSKSVSFVVIGDPHIKIENLKEFDQFIDKLVNLIFEKNPNFIVILGDILHNHERIHTITLNKAYEFIDRLRKITKTFVLVGNHDMISCSQFLSENHWMNALKEWDNITIVDKIVKETIFIENKENTFYFAPYVPPGRFIEALNTYDTEWKNASIIFAHQEFFGCKMGAIVSVEGDKWDTSYPEIISGHIHSRQFIQNNIYYTGSAMQNAFGESEKNIIAYVTQCKDSKYKLEEIELNLPRKKIVYMKVDDLEDYKIKNTQDEYKLSISGNYEEFKAIKKTKKFKELEKSGVKIVFKASKIETKLNDELRNELKTELDNRNDNRNDIVNEYNNELNENNFEDILKVLISKEYNEDLNKDYELVIHNRVVNDDIMFI